MIEVKILIVALVVAAGITTAVYINNERDYNEVHTAIVRQVENAGAGPLSDRTTAEISRWLALHQNVANTVNRECVEVRKTAPVDWFASLEGRVCAAALNAAFEPIPETGQTLEVR